MSISCSKCGKSFRTETGRAWHKQNSCPGASAGGGKLGRKVATRGRAKQTKFWWSKDVASDVILVVDPVEKTYYSITFDGDVRTPIRKARSIEDAKKKVEAAWKAGKLGKPGAASWAKEYKHRIGKGWYKQGA